MNKKIMAITAFSLLLSAGNAQAQNNNMTPEQMAQMMQMMQMMQKMQGNNNATDDGYSEELKQSRIEKRQFEDSEKLRSVGKAESRDEMMARDMAEQNARAQMQRQIETFTKDALERYRKQSQMNDAEKFMANDEQLSKTVAKGILTGCKVIDQAKYYNKNAKKYKYEVLVEYDKAGVMSLLEQQDAEIMKNKAMFEKQMQEVFDEYDMEKTGETAGMKKQKAQDAIDNANKDAEHRRAIEAEQQRADNEQKAMDKNYEYNLQSQKQFQDTVKDLSKEKTKRETIRNNDKNQNIKY